MNSVWRPWVKLAGAWITAVVLCLAALAFLVWQTSGPMGRRGQITNQVEQLTTEIESLETTVALALEERVIVAQTGVEIDRIAGEIFGRVDERLTAILRDIGVISRNAGLIPEGFGYNFRRQEKSGGVRFGTSLSVEGTYSQVRQLLSGLQASPQFLIVDTITFRGEEDPRSQALGIRLQVSTYLADAEPEELRALIDMLEVDGVELEGPLEETLPAQTSGDEISSEAEVNTPEESGEVENNVAPPVEAQPAVVEPEEAP